MGREAGGTQKVQGRGRGAGLSSLLLPSDLGPVLLLEIKCPSPPRRPTLRLWAHGHDGTSVGWAQGLTLRWKPRPEWSLTASQVGDSRVCVYRVGL